MFKVPCLKDENNTFTQISNSFINDKRISLKSKALLIFLISKPSYWCFNFPDILKSCTEGIKSIRSSIRELINFGYISYTQDVLPNHRFSFSHYIVSEKPIFLTSTKTTSPPHSPFRHAAEPHAAEPHAYNNITANLNLKKHEDKETTTTPTNVDNTKANVVDNLSPEEKQKRIEFLNSFGFINLKSLIKKYSLQVIYTNSKTYELSIRKAKRPTPYLVSSIKENWSRYELKDKIHPLIRIIENCSICDKEFYYMGYKPKHTECKIHRKIKK